jgi:hypothetical protein
VLFQRRFRGYDQAPQECTIRKMLAAAAGPHPPRLPPHVHHRRRNVDPGANDKEYGGMKLRIVASALGALVLLAASLTTGLATGRAAAAARSPLAWSAGKAIDLAAGDPRAVSCAPASSFCVAVDYEGSALTYNGTAWSLPASIDQAGELTAISCFSASFCAAADRFGQVLTYDGSHWSAPAVVNGITDLEAMSCPTSTFCVGAGAGIATYNAGTWTETNLAGFSGLLVSVSCQSASFCVAVDTQGEALVYDGAWNSPQDIDGSNFLTSVSCYAAGSCIAVDRSDNALSLSDGTWTTTSNVVTTVNGLASVSCVSASFCVAVSQEAGTAVIYTGSWSTATTVDSSSFPTSISCASTALCVVVDQGGYAFEYKSSDWTVPMAVDPGRTLAGISCSAATACAAVDTAGNVLTYSGSAWSTARVDPDLYLKSISCVQSGFCAAVDQVGHALTYTNGRWSAPANIDPGGALFSVSCASAVFCMAVDERGQAFKFDGMAWSGASDLDSDVLIQSVSCPTAQFCVAADQDSNVMIFNGTKWSAPSLLEPESSYATAVSCVSPSFCMAVDDNGHYLTYNGKSWTSPVPFDGAEPFAVSCATPSYCAAVDHSGSAYVYDGSSWTGGALAASPFVAVSCPSAGPCYAIASDGYVYEDALAPTTTTLSFVPASIVYGKEQAETLHVSVAAASGTPAGAVTVRGGSRVVCAITLVAAKGSCKLTATDLPAGRNALIATYSGSSDDASSHTTRTLSVSEAATRTALTVSAARIRVGHEQSERLAVKATPRYAGIATGTVKVTAGSKKICTIALRSGKGSCALSARQLSTGTYELVANYSGSADFTRSTSARERLTVT